MAEYCMICNKPLATTQDYHALCSRRFFETVRPPYLAATMENIREYASTNVLSRITVPGVQKKLSLGIEKTGGQIRFTIVGLWGRFVLKPPVEEYPGLCENEDTVLRLAEVAAIPTVPHGLINLASGERCYISRRIDRNAAGEKTHMEDMCQIAGRLTEDKYRASAEQVGKLIKKHCIYPGIDLLDFFNRVLFSFITGNADMHLKNYSLIDTPAGLRLCPAYDLVSTMLVIPDDPEESALTINGKKSKLMRKDFDVLAATLGLSRKQLDNVYDLLFDKETQMITAIGDSRMSIENIESLRSIVRKRLAVLKSI